MIHPLHAIAAHEAAQRFPGVRPEEAYEKLYHSWEKDWRLRRRGIELPLEMPEAFYKQYILLKKGVAKW